MIGPFWFGVLATLAAIGGLFVVAVIVAWAVDAIRHL